MWKQFHFYLLLSPNPYAYFKLYPLHVHDNHLEYFFVKTFNMNTSFYIWLQNIFMTEFHLIDEIQISQYTYSKIWQQN